jgi:hypothetical protein
MKSGGKKIRIISARITYKGEYHFFLYDGEMLKDVTEEWMDFFSSLSSDKEKDCEKLFIRRWKRKHGNILK